MNKSDIFAGVIFAMLITSLSYTSILLFEDIDSSIKRANSYKDVVCTGVIVLSGNGIVYKDVNTYTLAGKTYQMKDGETCWINDSYTNVEVK